MHDAVEDPRQDHSSAVPYQASILHRLLGQDRRDSGSWWLTYAAVALLAVLVYYAVLWLEGTLPARARLMHVVLPTFAFIGLPALALFDRLARRALVTARPVLRHDEPGHETMAYRLTTIPRGPAAVAALGGIVAFVGLTLIQPPDTYARLQILVTPVATVIELVFQALTWTSVGVGAFEIARKLWIIDEIYRHHIRIDVLSPGPVHAFSRLAAAMVAFTMFAVALGGLALAEFATTAQWFVAFLPPTVLAAVAFVAPLWGAHRAMAYEQARSVDALGTAIQKTIGQLRQHVDRGDLPGVGQLKDSLEALIVARREYLAVSTWPWQRSTLGGVVTALLAPLAVWLLTRVLERAAVGS